jgi:hypothetical protein
VIWKIKELKVVLKRFNFGINCATEDAVGEGVRIIFEVSMVAYGLGEVDGDGVLVGLAVAVGVGIALASGLGLPLTLGFAEFLATTFTPLLQTNFLPDLTQVYWYPETVEVNPILLHMEPGLTDA